jgi:predicted membrane protein
VLIGALIAVGLQRDNRLKWARIAAITGGVLLAYLVAYAIVSILTSGSDGFLVALSALFLFVSPATHKVDNTFTAVIHRNTCASIFLYVKTMNKGITNWLPAGSNNVNSQN